VLPNRKPFGSTGNQRVIRRAARALKVKPEGDAGGLNDLT